MYFQPLYRQSRSMYKPFAVIFKMTSCIAHFNVDLGRDADMGWSREFNHVVQQEILLANSGIWRDMGGKMFLKNKQIQVGQPFRHWMSISGEPYRWGIATQSTALPWTATTLRHRDQELPHAWPDEGLIYWHLQTTISTVISYFWG